MGKKSCPSKRMDKKMYWRFKVNCNSVSEYFVENQVVTKKFWHQTLGLGVSQDQKTKQDTHTNTYYIILKQ